jgi:hypothetical protein
MSVSSEGDPEGPEGAAWVEGVLAEGSGQVDRPGAAEAPMARLRRQATTCGPLPLRSCEWSSAKVTSHPVQAVLDRPVPAQQVGEPGGAGLGMGQAGDRVDDHHPPPPGAKLTDLAGHLDDLRGVWEPEPAHRDCLEVAQLNPAVRAVAGAVQHGHPPPGQAGTAA